MSKKVMRKNWTKNADLKLKGKPKNFLKLKNGVGFCRHCGARIYKLP